MSVVDFCFLIVKPRTGPFANGVSTRAGPDSSRAEEGPDPLMRSSALGTLIVVFVRRSGAMAMGSAVTPDITNQKSPTQNDEELTRCRDGDTSA
jgi:hypothetical protein